MVMVMVMVLLVAAARALEYELCFKKITSASTPTLSNRIHLITCLVNNEWCLVI